MLCHNPWQLAVVTAAAALSYAAWRRAGGPGWGSFLRLGLLLVALAVLLQPLASSAGETVLFELPSWRLGSGPAGLQIGGPVTFESVAFGVVRGLALASVLLTFAAFSAAVDPFRLVRSIPRFLYRSGIALSIALTFIPQTLAAQREIRQAMALRGRRFRGLADLVRLFVALLSSGLERSIDLAEAMEARGFGGETVASRDGDAGGRALNATIALGLALVVGGLYTLAAAHGAAGGPPWTAIGWLLIATGALAVALTLRAVARGVHRTRYRPQRWRRGDSLVAGVAVVALLAFAAVWLWRRHELTFYPYPRWQTPPFNPWLAAALALLAAPALAASRRVSEAAEPPAEASP